MQTDNVWVAVADGHTHRPWEKKRLNAVSKSVCELPGALIFLQHITERVRTKWGPYLNVGLRTLDMVIESTGCPLLFCLLPPKCGAPACNQNMADAKVVRLIAMVVCAPDSPPIRYFPDSQQHTLT
jgi:hypothetical protein